jgi:G patch domain-containing protein 1
MNNKSSLSKLDSQQQEQTGGRQRLHGAFKGGFSAGYHNTVGSEAGFQPQKYKSNRNEKGSFAQQKLDFMDDEVRVRVDDF